MFHFVESRRSRLLAISAIKEGRDSPPSLPARQYLNNIIEQDHRVIKRRVNAQQGFPEFHVARRTIKGYEAIHMLRKGQGRLVSGTDVRHQNQFINKVFELVA